MKTVKNCFGKYGTKEMKDCNDDCSGCGDIFCKKKAAYPCDILCEDVEKCKSCYWSWWDQNKNRRCSLEDNIKRFMIKSRIKFKNGRKRTNRQTL